jgi:hypothetical protein
MDRIALRDAVYQLAELASRSDPASYAYRQAIQQFNSLLELAKSLYPNRVDIQAIERFEETSIILNYLKETVFILKTALDLRPPSSAAETLAQIKLPPDAPADVFLDMRELEGAVNIELHKTALLLAGSIAEALLLSRHPNNSDRPPGLSELLQQARKERLLGRDTLRNLETLVDYRNLIHPRAERRNQTIRNQARVETAVAALKLLCSDLEDTTVRFS